MTEQIIKRHNRKLKIINVLSEERLVLNQPLNDNIPI